MPTIKSTTLLACILGASIYSLTFHVFLLNHGSGYIATSRVAFITFCHLEGIERFRAMIIGSLETWMSRNDQVYYVVLSSVWKRTYQDLLKNESFPTQHMNRVVPLFVDCPEGRFGESPCCKQEKGLLEFQRRELHHEYDWVVFMDDDTYMRVDYLTRFVSQHSHKQPLLFTGGMPARRLGQSGYWLDSPYKCSKAPEYTYPHGQPVVYSRGALETIRNGLELGGLVKQCLEYNVTHDAGNAILHWMYSIPQVWIRVAQRPDKFRPDFLGVHGIERCKVRKCDMAFVHKYYSTHASLVAPPTSEFEYQWHRVNGFKKTETFYKHGDPIVWTMEWHTMPLQDCKGTNETQNA